MTANECTVQIETSNEDAPAEPTRVDLLRDGLTAAIIGAPIGQPAVWAQDGVTIEVVGGPRARVTWPGTAITEITLSTPDGECVRLTGDEIRSWDDLFARIDAMGEEWRTAIEVDTRELRRRHRAVELAETRLTQQRAARDEMVRRLVTAGVTRYRVAKLLSVPESTIGRIVARLAA